MAKFKKLCWTEADVKCPFYISDDQKTRSICCEGYSEKSRTRTSFETLRERERHMGRLCTSRFWECPMHRLIVENKYQEDGDA